MVNFVDELGRIVDPKFRLSPVLKFILQAGVASIALLVSGVGITGIHTQTLFVEFGLLVSLLLTIVWVGLCTNAINRFDGVYGLASGSSSIGFVTIASLLTRVVLPLYPEISAEKAMMIESAIWLSRLFA